MELRDFVRETITQIVEGVVEARKIAAAHGARVGPRQQGTHKENQRWTHADSGHPLIIQDVAFDVALTAVEGSGREGGTGLQVASLVSIGGKLKSEESTTTASRISFVVPLALPPEEQQ